MARWAAALVLVLALAGCATETGVSSGATVSVYLSAPLRGEGGAPGRALCAEARRALAAAGAETGDIRVRLQCLDAGDPTGTWTLARVGANARRAVEDSTTAAFISDADPKAERQSRPILEEADIATIPATDGASAMNRVLNAIDAADPASLRESLFEFFESSLRVSKFP